MELQKLKEEWEKRNEVWYEGEIVYWNSPIGFINYENSDENVFFHLNNVNKSYKTISLLDKVTFKAGQSKKGKHSGKPVALNIRLISKGAFSEYIRTIGILIDWNGTYGFLDSPQLDKEVFLFHTRLLKTEYEINNGDFFTFSPIKSTKKPNQLFAFFAYPLEEEKDLEFLRQQKNENDIAQIEKIISSLIRTQDKSAEERFKSELREILESTTQNIYIQISELLSHYKNHFNFIPSFELLTKKIRKEYLIQLWENDVINVYDLETMVDYFHNSSADTKRAIINKFVKEDKIKILRAHLNLLLQKGKLRKINNDVKTFLDIVHRNEETQELEIYKELKKYFLEHFTPKECVTLWVNEYIDDLPERYIVDNFDINNAPTFKRENKKHQRILFKIYENYLLTFAEEKNFEVEYPELIQYLKIFNEQFGGDFEGIAKASISRLNTIQKLILWTFESNLPFEGEQYIEDNWDKLNVYFLLKYLINDKIEPTASLVKEKVESISETKLIDFVTSYKWNNLILPVNEPNKDSFLSDVVLFIEKYERSDIKLDNMADAIYDTIPLYTIHHLRLWLLNYIEDARFDYVGFREKFKELTHNEQKEFRKRGDIKIKEDIKQGELLEVEPCENIISAEGDFTTYKALIWNVFFREGSVQLRLKNKEYTIPHPIVFASSGLNRIPKSNFYSQFEFILKVKNKEIVEAKGFEDFFTEIQTGEIKKALGRIVPPKTSRENRNKSYVEDWKLRKKVIDYLNEIQVEEFLPKLVLEPKNRYRRIDIETEIDNFEKTHLYSIKTSDGFGIIWENIDLTEDRATFIFKALKSTHDVQIGKIANSIVSFGQFRSTLISAKAETKLQIFKGNLGYVAKIHKQRGKNQPFSNWKEKLEASLMHPIPDLPTNEQIQSLEGWQVDMPRSSPKLRKVIKKIDEKTVKVTDIDFSNVNVDKKRIEDNVLISSNAKKSILEKLQEINQIIKRK